MIRTVSSFLSEFWNLYQSGGLKRGESSGFVSLDPYYTIRKGEWTLVTGIPRHGKSSFVDNLIVHLADKQQWKWLIYSPENYPIARHAGQLAEIYIGRSFRPGLRERMTSEDFTYAAAFLDTQIQFVEPGMSWDLPGILEFAADTGVHGVVVDPWNRLHHRMAPNQSETQYIGEQLGVVSDFVRTHPVHVFIVAHPQKLIRQKLVEGGQSVYPVPTPYDVSGSAHWLNMADNCLCVWRNHDNPNSETEIHVQKIRFREVGQIGMCPLMYDATNGQYVDKFMRPRRFDLETYRDELQARIERHEEELAKLEESNG